MRLPMCWTGPLLGLVMAAAAPAAAATPDPLQPLRADFDAVQARAAPPTLPREAFLGRPGWRLPRLAPDGLDLVFVRDAEGQASLWRLDLRDPAARPVRLLPRTTAEALHFSHDGRQLFVVAPDQLSVIGRDGRGARTLLRLNHRRVHEVLAPDRSRPAAMLLLEHSAPGAATRSSRVLRVSADGAVEELFAAAWTIADALVAPSGELAFLRRADGGRHTLLRRTPEGWQAIGHCRALERCSLLAVDGEGGFLQHGNRSQDLAGLQRWRPGEGWRALHQDPRGEADLDEVVLDPVTQAPLFASYRSTTPAVHALAPALAAPLARLQSRLPGRDLALQPGHGGGWLVVESDARLPQPRWHLYSPADDTLRRLLPEADAGLPSPDQLAQKFAITWTASDGRRLHGFLTLPPGRDPAQVPLLTGVHGGPWSAARPGFSPMVQFFANRGFAVFEPNFRGSTGHGRGHLLAAGGDFGNGRVQRDIVEGTRFLLAHGIGDRNRVAIYGASFGGYSALLGATFEPGLFRLALAAVPPADFGWALRWAVQSSDLSLNPGMPFEERLRALGTDPADDALVSRLHAQSPQANAARLSRPVLLFAGGRDERVAIRSVTHYAATLQGLGKDASLFIEPAGGHQLDDRLTREAWLYLCEQQLHRHLGTAAPAPPGPGLRAHLRRHLRLAPPPTVS